MKSGKPGDAQQLERLALAPSSWRILNLYRATRGLAQAPGGLSQRFFGNRRLSSAIVIKHTLRDHERAIFDEPPIVATKMLIPLDENSMATGAISFFVGERAYPAIMRQSFGINVSQNGRDRDARILARLDESPSLDLFLLRELLGSDDFKIPKDYFQISLLEDTSVRAFVTRELTPLIRMAMADAGWNKITRFVDSIFGTEIGAQAADFFLTLGLAQNHWPAIVFAWKAALFYENQFAAMKERVVLMMTTLRELRTYGHNDLYPRSYVDTHLGNLKDFVERAFGRVSASAADFNSARRASIIESGRLQELRSYLESLPETIRGFGAYSAVIDHILSYWAHRTRGMDHTRLQAELFCTVAADICAMESQFNVTSQTQPYAMAG